MDEPVLTHDHDTCHRLALDHVLKLIAGADWSEQLVLRGSMLMTAYAGSAARKPADLDFIVAQDGWPVDTLDPYPYVDELAAVQQWPEVADGAGRPELWAEEEFGTGGQKPRVSPEGLNWVMDDDWERSSPYADLRTLVQENSLIGDGLVLDADGFQESNDWMYSYYEMPGVRIIIPWRTTSEAAPGSPGLYGEVSLDFALDETLPQRPLWVRIPRLGGGHSVMRGASPELSLAWKLTWLVEDVEMNGASRGKDLYDAVVLAELVGAPRWERLAGLDMSALTGAQVAGLETDWAEFTSAYPQVRGTVEEWKQRLVNALGLA
jgi:hypothetical protein